MSRLWRWALLAVFPLGYLSLDRSIGPAGPSVLVFTALNMAACGILLTRLSAPLKYTLWVWTSLALFVDGYFLRMFWFAHKVNTPAYIDLWYSETRWVTPSHVIDSYSWVTLGFVTFCLAATLALALTTKVDRATERLLPPATRLAGPTMHIVVVTVIGYALVTFVQISLNYGVLGLANPSLPFRLGSAMTLFQRYVAPGILLVGVWIFDQRRSRWANVTALLIAGLALVDGLVSTSRGSLISLTLPVFVLWILTDRFTASRKMAAAVLIVTGVALYPVISDLRQEKLNPGVMLEPVALSVDSLVNSTMSVVSRVGAGGVDGVWFAKGSEGRPSAPRMLSFLKPNALTIYYTQSVVRVRTPNDFRPPGWTGGLMIVGGAAGVVILGGLLVALIALLWAYLLNLATWPVSLGAGASTIATFVSGGSLDWALFVKLGLQVLVCEVMYRRLLRSLPTIGPPPSKRARTGALTSPGVA